MTIQAALVATRHALIAIQGPLTAIQAAPIGNNLAQLVSQAALVRFYRPLEGKNLALGRIQAALTGKQLALTGKQLAQLVSKAALFI